MQAMELNADFDARVVLDTRTEGQRVSPGPGVEYGLLEQSDRGIGRTTCIVRCAPGSPLPPEESGPGVELLVLAGAVEDGERDYPAGTYVRNPHGSTPLRASSAGCELFVKRRAFQAGDDACVVIDTGRAPFRPGLVQGLSVLPLHEFGTEHAALVRWAPGTLFQAHSHWGGEEILVLEGVFSDEHGDYPAGTWIRSPHLSRHHPFSEPGCLIYVKVGHLGA